MGSTDQETFLANPSSRQVAHTLIVNHKFGYIYLPILTNIEQLLSYSMLLSAHGFIL